MREQGLECYRIQGMIKIRFEQLKGGLPIKNLKYGQWPTFVLIIPFPQCFFSYFFLSSKQAVLHDLFPFVLITFP